MRHTPITGNLSRGRQAPMPTNRAAVPIVKRTPTVTPKGPGNMSTTINASSKFIAGKTTAKPVNKRR